jgi:hypothetical protein
MQQPIPNTSPQPLPPNTRLESPDNEESSTGSGQTIEDQCNQYHDQLGLSQPCNHYVIGNQLKVQGHSSYCVT